MAPATEALIENCHNAKTSAERTVAYRKLWARLDTVQCIRNYSMGKTEYLSSLGILPEQLQLDKALSLIVQLSKGKDKDSENEMSYNRHYCYKIIFEDGCAYYGSRTCRCSVLLTVTWAAQRHTLRSG